MNDRVAKKVEISCGTMVYNNNEMILLVKTTYPNSPWGLPKGHIEKGESLEDCAIRETFEETAIQVALEKLLDPVVVERSNTKKIVHIFTAQQICDNEPSGDLDPDGITLRAEWFHIDDLPIVAHYQKKIIEQGVRYVFKRKGYVCQ